jgi:hypothetical protein
MEKLFLPAVKGLFTCCFAVIAATAAFGQVVETPNAAPAKATTPKPATPKPSPTPKPVPKDPKKLATAEEIAEAVVFYYAFPAAGRRWTRSVKRRSSAAAQALPILTAVWTRPVYQRYVIRAESLDKEKIRMDLELPTAKFSLIRNDDKIFGVYNNTVFTPREDAVKQFENQIFHGLEALLRYKENESTLELQPREKIMGVDYNVIDVTDKQGRKTRFYISVKTYRVMILSYEDGGIKYRRKFYDYNYAQGTLVPSHSVLWADDKIVEDSEVLNVKFGQKVDEDLFRAG